MMMEMRRASGDIAVANAFIHDHPPILDSPSVAIAATSITSSPPPILPGMLLSSLLSAAAVVDGVAASRAPIQHADRFSDPQSSATSSWIFLHAYIAQTPYPTLEKNETSSQFSTR